MAEANAQAPLAKEGEKEKKPTTLENIAKEFKSGVIEPVIAAGALAASDWLFGIDGLLIAASFPLGRAIVEYARKDRKGEITTAKLRDESITGALFAPAVLYGVNAVHNLTKASGLDGLVTNILGYSVPVSSIVAGGLAFGVLTPLLAALYYPLSEAVEHKTLNPKTIFADFKKNYVRGLIKTLPLTALTSIAIGATYTGASYTIPFLASYLSFLAPYLLPAVIAVSNIGYRILLSPEKISYVKLLFSPISAPLYLSYQLATGAVSATIAVGKNLVNLAYKGFKAFYEAGSGIGKVFEGVPQPAPAR